MSSIAVSVDLRTSLGPARNQGTRPTCLAFAASDAHAAVRPDWHPLSCEFVFYHAQQRAGRPPHQGALLSVMLETLRVDGQPEESGWPYLEQAPADGASWAPPAMAGPLFARNGGQCPPSVRQIIAELDQGNPVIILLMLSRAFFSPSTDAVVHPAPSEQPEPQRRHAVVGVGHGVVDGDQAVLIRNSWGAKWGDNGHAWLTEVFLGPRLLVTAVLAEEVYVSAQPHTA